MDSTTQTNNDTPVIIKVGKTPVEIIYSDTDTTFTDCFERYLKNV